MHSGLSALPDRAVVSEENTVRPNVVVIDSCRRRLTLSGDTGPVGTPCISRRGLPLPEETFHTRNSNLPRSDTGQYFPGMGNAWSALGPTHHSRAVPGERA